MSEFRSPRLIVATLAVASLITMAAWLIWSDAFEQVPVSDAPRTALKPSVPNDTSMPGVQDGFRPSGVLHVPNEAAKPEADQPLNPADAAPSINGSPVQAPEQAPTQTRNVDPESGRANAMVPIFGLPSSPPTKAVQAVAPNDRTDAELALFHEALLPKEHLPEGAIARFHSHRHYARIPAGPNPEERELRCQLVFVDESLAPELLGGLKVVDLLGRNYANADAQGKFNLKAKVSNKHPPPVIDPSKLPPGTKLPAQPTDESWRGLFACLTIDAPLFAITLTQAPASHVWIPLTNVNANGELEIRVARVERANVHVTINPYLAGQSALHNGYLYVSMRRSMPGAGTTALVRIPLAGRSEYLVPALIDSSTSMWVCGEGFRSKAERIRNDQPPGGPTCLLTIDDLNCVLVRGRVTGAAVEAGEEVEKGIENVLVTGMDPREIGISNEFGDFEVFTGLDKNGNGSLLSFGHHAYKPQYLALKATSGRAGHPPGYWVEVRLESLSK